MGKTYIFAGHAQLPEGTDIYENFKYVTVVAEVDMENGMIVNCSVPIYCQESSDFVTSFLKGRSLETDVDAIIAEIDERMHTMSKRALINALQAIVNRYNVAKKNVVVRKIK